MLLIQCKNFCCNVACHDNNACYDNIACCENIACYGNMACYDIDLSWWWVMIKVMYGEIELWSKRNVEELSYDQREYYFTWCESLSCVTVRPGINANC